MLPVVDVLADVLTDDVQVWAGGGHHLVCYKLRGGALFNIVATVHSARQARGWNTIVDATDLRAAFGEACPAVKLLLNGITDWRMWVLSARDPIADWTTGCVTLLGDAAHPMLPYLAQGASMAIEDAVCLADCCAASLGNLPRAFAAYARARAPRTGSVQLAAREAGRAYHLEGAARDVRNAAMRAQDPDDYEANAWLFDSSGPRPGATGSLRPACLAGHSGISTLYTARHFALPPSNWTGLDKRLGDVARYSLLVTPLDQ